MDPGGGGRRVSFATLDGDAFIIASQIFLSHRWSHHRGAPAAGPPRGLDPMARIRALLTVRHTAYRVSILTLQFYPLIIPEGSFIKKRRRKLRHLSDGEGSPAYLRPGERVVKTGRSTGGQLPRKASDGNQGFDEV